MFCKNCGETIDENAVVCPRCGVQVGKFDTEKEKKGNILAIVGFVLAFFIPIAGLICGILGYKASKRDNAPYGGLALAAIVISIVAMVIEVIWVIVVIAAAAAAATYVADVAVLCAAL